MADFDTYAGIAPGGNPHSHEHTRAARHAAARAYMQALGASIAAGEQGWELHHDHAALASAGQQLLDLCRTLGVDAPMVLA